MQRGPLLVILGVATFVGATFVAPDVIYDQFIWRYFIGPVVADAVGHSVSYHGVEAVAGYTLLSELVYGIILLVAFYLLYRFFRVFHIEPDLSFFIGASPFLVLGATLRVLEDSGLFRQPLSYFFISPLIYAQIGFYFLGGIGIGLLMRRKKDPYARWRLIFFVMAVMVASYVIAYLTTADHMKLTMHPGWMIIFILISMGCFYLWKKQGLAATLFSMGLPLVLSSFYYIGQWILGNQWDTVGTMHLIVIPLVLTLTLGIILLIYILGRWRQIPWLVSSINLSLIFGHMIDGWTSYLAVVDPLGIGISYGEKHPIPLFLMEIGNGIAYPVAKLLVIIAIIFGTDVYLKEDLADRTTLTNLAKFFVLILGLSPGLRDILRIVMGT
jgi:uncharacterized membrane protein